MGYLNLRTIYRRTFVQGRFVFGLPMIPSSGGVTGRPETMCPRTNVLGPLVPYINRPRNFNIPGLINLCRYMHDTSTIHIQYVIKMTGMYQFRDNVSQGTINLGTSGHIVLGRRSPHPSPKICRDLRFT